METMNAFWFTNSGEKKASGRRGRRGSVERMQRRLAGESSRHGAEPLRDLVL